jgi:hypothetical protein
MNPTENSKSTTDKVIAYIEEHPSVKSCLRKGVINYSSLAREISSELNIKKESSFDAIVVALRRYKIELDKKKDNEKSIISVLSNSETEIKNKIIVYVLTKTIDLSKIDELQETIRTEYGTFYFIEGSASYTIITQEKYSPQLEQKLKNSIIKQNNKMSMINIKTTKDIEKTSGVISFLSGLLAENGINIYEIISCWTDSIFIIEKKDLNKAISLFNFE